MEPSNVHVRPSGRSQWVIVQGAESFNNLKAANQNESKNKMRLTSNVKTENIGKIAEASRDRG